MNKSRSRKKIVWVSNDGRAPAPFAAIMPSFSQPIPFPNEWAESLVPGTLWASCAPLSRATLYNPLNNQIVNELSDELVESYVGTIPPGSIMIYAGTMRREERDHQSRIINVLCHTFIVAGGRYVIKSPRVVRPC